VTTRAQRIRAHRGNPDPIWNPVRKDWGLRIELPSPEGRPRNRKWIRAKTEADCRYKWRVAVGQLEDFSVLPSEQVTVADVAAQYLEAQRKRVSAGTLAAYENRVNNHVVKALGHIRLRSLATKDVDGWQLQLQEQGLALNTRKELRSSLVKMINWAMGQDLVLRNVASKSPGPRGDTGKVVSLTRSQAMAVLDAVQGWRLEAAVVLMMTTGLRIGETLGLRWIDLAGNQLHVRGQLVTKPSLRYQHSTKTVESTRTIEMPQRALVALQAHRNRQDMEREALGLGPSEYLFLTRTQVFLDPSTLGSELRELTAHLGVRVHPHVLRHTAASLMIDSGVPIEIVSKVLGHKSIRTTVDTYGHLLDRGKTTAASAMDEALG
jgi:integrase